MIVKNKNRLEVCSKRFSCVYLLQFRYGMEREKTRGSEKLNRELRAPAWRWSWKRDLNTRPAHYECAALPTELFQR